MAGKFEFEGRINLPGENGASEQHHSSEQEPDECAFCGIRDGSVEAGIVEQTDLSMTVISLGGHPMVIPTRHVTDPAELTIEEGAEIFGKSAQLVAVVKEAFGATGANLAMNIGYDAGQRVNHLHMHVIPRTPRDKKVYFRSQEDTSLEERLQRAQQLTELLRQRQQPSEESGEK